MSHGSRKVRLAIILPPDKARKIKLGDRISQLCQERNIEITDIDVKNTEQIEGEYDVLIHKALDFYNEPGVTAEEGEILVRKVQNFIKNNPQMAVIDDPVSSEKISDRKNCHKIMVNSTLTKNGIEVFVPKSVEIPDGLTVDEIRDFLHRANVQFPIIAKPMHTNDKLMSMIFSLDDVHAIRTPSLVQEFFNHNGVMYKVFVIGDRYHIIQRPSIKDYATDSNQKPIYLDSRDVSKMGRGFHPHIHHSDPSKQTWRNSFDDPDLLKKSVVSELCKRLKHSSGLQLYGVDILVLKETGNYAIVDINQFPGYKGIPDKIFAEDIVKMILQNSGCERQNEC